MILFYSILYKWRPLRSMLHVPYHSISFFPFDGVPKFIYEQLAKVPKIYCFINVLFWWYQGGEIQTSQGMLLLNNSKIPDYSTQDFFSPW